MKKCHFQAETEHQGPTSSIFRAKKRVGFPICGRFTRRFHWTEFSVPHGWGMTPHRSRIIEFQRCGAMRTQEGLRAWLSDMDLGNAVLVLRPSRAPLRSVWAVAASAGLGYGRIRRLVCGSVKPFHPP